MSDPRRRHDTGRLARSGHNLIHRRHGVAFDGRAVPAVHIGVHANDARLGLDARHHRRPGARRVGGLGVGIVGLYQREVRESFMRLNMVITIATRLLTGPETRGIVCAYAIPIGDQDDHIPGGVGVNLLGKCGLQCSLARGKPFIRYLRQLLGQSGGVRQTYESCGDFLEHGGSLSKRYGPGR